MVLHLIHITINTLNAQYHSCRPHAAAGPLYSDNSNISRYSEKEKGETKLYNKIKKKAFSTEQQISSLVTFNKYDAISNNTVRVIICWLYCWKLIFDSKVQRFRMPHKYGKVLCFFLQSRRRQCF